MESKHEKPLQEFYSFYLNEHRNDFNRRLHVVGTGLVILTFLSIIFSGNYAALWLLPIIGYGFAWVGHFFFEKNKPATFKHPIYSLACDFLMFRDVLLGRVKW